MRRRTWRGWNPSRPKIRVELRSHEGGRTSLPRRPGVNNRGLADLKLRDFEEAVRIDPGQREAKENLKLLGQAAPEP